MATLDEIYSEVPDAGCKGLCQAACGPILFEQIELDRLRAALRHGPVH